MTTNHHLSTSLPAEDELLACLVSNDQRHFGRIYDRFSGALLSIIRKWVKDPELSENLLQDVFVKAWKNRFLYEEEKGRLFTWLYKIARNSCIDYFRSRACKKSRVFVFGEDIPCLAAMHAEEGGVQPDAIGLRQIVDTLRKEEKEVVDLVYFKGLTQRQVAEMMNLPLGTVKTRMSRAIKELRCFFKSDWQKAETMILLN
ncbi:MAG: RNA polymerase sigma factor [Chitinophagaceae bacterium]|nr:RNA polymerase sigma factor [Chitinophagaceae bacterium]